MDKYSDNIMIYHFIKSILKSLIILAIWLAHSGAIYSRIALSFALNHIFFSASENGTVKQNNQSDFKAFLTYPISLQENERQRTHCLAKFVVNNNNPIIISSCTCSSCSLAIKLCDFKMDLIKW